jgi:hypothetical protein
MFIHLTKKKSFRAPPNTLKESNITKLQPIFDPNKKNVKLFPARVTILRYYPFQMFGKKKEKK